MVMGFDPDKELTELFRVASKPTSLGEGKDGAERDEINIRAELLPADILARKPAKFCPNVCTPNTHAASRARAWDIPSGDEAVRSAATPSGTRVSLGLLVQTPIVALCDCKSGDLASTGPRGVIIRPRVVTACPVREAPRGVIVTACSRSFACGDCKLMLSAAARRGGPHESDRRSAEAAETALEGETWRAD